VPSGPVPNLVGLVRPVSSEYRLSVDYLSRPPFTLSAPTRSSRSFHGSMSPPPFFHSSISSAVPSLQKEEGPLILGHIAHQEVSIGSVQRVYNPHPVPFKGATEARSRVILFLSRPTLRPDLVLNQSHPTGETLNRSSTLTGM